MTEVPPINEANEIRQLVYWATVDIAYALKSAFGQGSDGFGRVVSNEAQSSFNPAIQHIPELVLRIGKEYTELLRHFIPGYTSRKLSASAEYECR
jgi:hypothetical protein